MDLIAEMVHNTSVHTLGWSVGLSLGTECLVSSERCGTLSSKLVICLFSFRRKAYRRAWVDNHNHTTLAMLSLTAVDNHGLSVGHSNIKSWLGGSVGCNRDEARVELSTWLASGIGSTSGGSVVLVQEGESDGITSSGGDRCWGEDQLLVATHVDILDSSKSGASLGDESNGL
jgi:hypothetical protein